MKPSRGEIWPPDLDPVRGHEQGRVRPVLIVSNDTNNHGHSGLITVVPITTKSRPLRSYIRLTPPEAGLQRISFLICDQLRTITKDRLTKRYGTIRPSTLAEVEGRIKFHLDLR